MSASAPTLFMNAESTATIAVCTTSWVGRPLRGASTRTITSTSPACCSARLITRTAATVITAGWAKPSKARSIGSTPVSEHGSSAIIATRS
jgi:hypothetical protein